MSYSKRNLLLRIIEIQDIVLEYKGKGATQTWVYNNIIFPKYSISHRTFYTYLSINARKDIRKVEAQGKCC